MFVDSNSSSVYLAASLSTTITGNRFEGMASTVNQTGIKVVASYPDDTGAVIGNNFYNLKTGVTFGANTGRWVVNSNAYFGNVATQVSNGATVPVDNKIGNCTTISGSSLPTTIQPAQPINLDPILG